MALNAKGLDCCTPGSDTLLAYAFCARPSSLAEEGDVSVVFINIDTDRHFNVTIDIGGNSMGNSGNRNHDRDRSDFILEADGSPALRSRRVRLNGNQLRLGEEGDLPFFHSQKRKQSDPLIVPPLSLAFAVLHNISARACFAQYDTIT